MAALSDHVQSATACTSASPRRKFHLAAVSRSSASPTRTEAAVGTALDATVNPSARELGL